IGCLLLLATSPALAQRTLTRETAKAVAPVSQTIAARDNTPANVLSAEEGQRVGVAVNTALDWLANQHQPDDSFPTLETGQPGVTCLCMMALISHGHVPGDKRFGARLERATDFAISCQKQNGLVTLVGPEGREIDRNVEHEIGTCAAYNHAISSLTLSEMYGMSDGERARRIQAVINKSLAATILMQRWPKDREDDRGGWRYI